MKYYIPQFKLGILSPPQSSAIDKFGGLPWGFPSSKWPFCQNCGKSMALVAQLFHHSERLPLGQEGCCLFVFMCSNPEVKPTCVCNTWDSETGGNTCLLLMADELGTGLTYPPDVHNPYTAQLRNAENCSCGDNWDSKRTIWINTEVYVLNWEEHNDDIPENFRSAFLKSDVFEVVPRDIGQKSYSGTKLGSVPAWIQSPYEHIHSFLGQFSDFEFDSPIPTANELGCTIVRGAEGSRYAEDPNRRCLEGPVAVFEFTSDDQAQSKYWLCNTPNYGDGGMGYIFRTPHSYEFIWQCY